MTAEPILPTCSTSMRLRAKKSTVSELLVTGGKACAAYHDEPPYHDEHLRNVQAEQVEVDKTSSFTYFKRKNVARAMAAPHGVSDTWTLTDIDADNQIVLSYFIRSRDGECAAWFIFALKACRANRVQLTSDCHKAFLQAVEGAFGADVDYAQIVEIYGNAPGSATSRYSPAECTGSRKSIVGGSPDKAHVSTSYAEHKPLTLLIHVHRFTRLINAFSKKVESHTYTVAFQLMYYNVLRLHAKLRMRSAMAVVRSDRLCEISDIVAIVEAADMKPGKRDPYKIREALSEDYC